MPDKPESIAPKERLPRMELSEEKYTRRISEWHDNREFVSDKKFIRLKQRIKIKEGYITGISKDGKHCDALVHKYLSRYPCREIIEYEILKRNNPDLTLPTRIARRQLLHGMCAAGIVAAAVTLGFNIFLYAQEQHKADQQRRGQDFNNGDDFNNKDEDPENREEKEGKILRASITATIAAVSGAVAYFVYFLFFREKVKRLQREREVADEKKKAEEAKRKRKEDEEKIRKSAKKWREARRRNRQFEELEEQERDEERRRKREGGAAGAREFEELWDDDEHDEDEDEWEWPRRDEDEEEEYDDDDW